MPESYLDHTSVCTQVHSLLRTILNCYQFISFSSFVLFFYFSNKITYSAVWKICFLWLPYKFSDILVVSLVCFKKMSRSCLSSPELFSKISLLLSYMLLCGSSNPTDHLHVLEMAPLILLFPFVRLLRYLKMVGFVYSVELEQPGSKDKNYCIGLKVAWGVYVPVFLNKVHPLITSVELWGKNDVCFLGCLVLFCLWFCFGLLVGSFLFTLVGTSCWMVRFLPCLKARESWMLNAYTSRHSMVTWIICLNKWQY